MIINEILAIAWFVICSVWAFNLSRNLPGGLNLVSESDRVPLQYIVAVIFVLALIGIAASVLLVAGATWARWLIGLVALANALESVSGFIVPRKIPMSLFSKITAMVSVITLVIVIGWATKIFRF